MQGMALTAPYRPLTNSSQRSFFLGGNQRSLPCVVYAGDLGNKKAGRIRHAQQDTQNRPNPKERQQPVKSIYAVVFPVMFAAKGRASTKQYALNLDGGKDVLDM